MEPETIGGRIARARRQLGCLLDRDIDTGELAKMLDTTYTTVYNWERDAKKPGEKIIPRLSSVLGVTPAYIMYGQLPKELPGWTPERRKREIVHRGQPRKRRKSKEA